MKRRRTKIKELYLQNIGVVVGNFSHPHSRKEGHVAMGIVCGYDKKNIIVKLTNCEGWHEKEMKKAKIKVAIEEESQDHKNGYWFISKRELIELSAVYNVKE